MPPTKKPAHKLNIFQVLGSLGKKNPAFYDDLSDDERKALQPFVVIRWMSGTSDARQIVFLNELVNPYVFPLTNHKQLLVNLLSAASSGRGGKVNWVKALSKKTSKTPTLVQVVCDTYGYNKGDAIDALPLLPDEDLMSMATELGYQPDQIKLIKKELKAR